MPPDKAPLDFLYERHPLLFNSYIVAFSRFAKDAALNHCQEVAVVYPMFAQLNRLHGRIKDGKELPICSRLAAVILITLNKHGDMIYLMFI